MNLVLIGYRGTGKSVIAELLADKLKMKIFGMDAEIVKKAGLSIPEIVEKYGWPKFRDIETAIAGQAGQLDNVIVDTGGGVIERPENVKALRLNARIFWLKASVDTIVSRIETDSGRPALTAGKSFTEEVADILTQRTPKYRNAADYEIETDKKTPSQLVSEIIELWKKAGV